MQNVPRIFIDQKIKSGDIVPVEKDVVHYLTRVMRRTDCLVFNSGVEYRAELVDNNKNLKIGNKTEHGETGNDLVLYFAPIKKMDDLLNMATQMGVAVLQPVITDRTVANHINWDRMKKIIIEASEQSGRNSIPNLLSPIKFDDLDLSDLIVADERAGHGKEINNKINKTFNKILIGPEGGFSMSEFEKMDAAGVCGMSLGKTILRAEVAAVVAIAKVLNK